MSRAPRIVRVRYSRVKYPGSPSHIHAAAEFAGDPVRLERCLADIAEGHIIINMMLFLEDHFQPLLPALAARRDACDAMVCAMSAGEVIKLTRMGRFDMSAPSSGPMALLKKLRGNKGAAGSRGRQSDGGIAPDAEAVALHSGHGAGCARVFPDAPILARGFGREHGQHGEVSR